MALTEMIPHDIPIPYQLPATPPCSPHPSTPEHSRLGSQVKGLRPLQSGQAPTIEDLEHLSSQLVKGYLPVMTGESVASELVDREIHSSGDDTPVTVPPLFDEDEWEPIGISRDSDSDLSREASSDGAFSDTSTDDSSSETSSDGNSSEANEQYIDISLLWTEKGFVNGSMGKIHDLFWEEGADPATSQIQGVMVKFDGYTGPALTPKLAAAVSLRGTQIITGLWHRNLSASGRHIVHLSFPMMSKRNHLDLFKNGKAGWVPKGMLNKGTQPC